MYITTVHTYVTVQVTCERQDSDFVIAGFHYSKLKPIPKRFVIAICWYSTYMYIAVESAARSRKSWRPTQILVRVEKFHVRKTFSILPLVQVVKPAPSTLIDEPQEEPQLAFSGLKWLSFQLLMCRTRRTLWSSRRHLLPRWTPVNGRK